MDERGTPLNQSPTINEKDVDLYKLFKVNLQSYKFFIFTFCIKMFCLHLVFWYKNSYKCAKQSLYIYIVYIC